MDDISAILLAAGSSSRFGQAKLLQPFQGGDSVGVASAKNLSKVFSNVVAVVRPEDNALIHDFSALNFRVVINEQAGEGIASSLRAGIKADKASRGWLIALADMPWVKPETLNVLRRQLLNGSSLVAPVYAGQRGNPVGFSSKWRAQLLTLKGDKGARDLLARYPDELLLVETKDEGVLIDVDYPGDLNYR